MNANKLATGLAWFSLGLGCYEAIFPKHLSHVLGLKGREGLLRFYGLRELTAGAGIFFSQPHPAAWVWSRVGGDALDIATLATALRPDNPKRLHAGVALGAVVGITALDILCGKGLTTSSDDHSS
jgi:hypothetical protein